jgi:hypothetical protein
MQGAALCAPQDIDLMSFCEPRVAAKTRPIKINGIFMGNIASCDGILGPTVVTFR